MKSFRQMKKWTLMSVLLCGISLAAYAIIPQVRIMWWTLTDITSTSAHLVVLHQGASYFRLDVCTPEGERVKRHYHYPGATSPEEEIFSVMDIENLTPNTTYMLKILVKGLPGDTDHVSADSTQLYFTTEPELR